MNDKNDTQYTRRISGSYQSGEPASRKNTVNSDRQGAAATGRRIEGRLSLKSFWDVIDGAEIHPKR